MLKDYWNIIFDLREENFLGAAKTIFRYQIDNVNIYRDYVKSIAPKLISNPNSINSIEEIPFLPIEAFKQEKIISKQEVLEQIFASSGTTGEKSQHYVAYVELYKKSFTKCFELFYGDVSSWHILALLPSYIEQGNSSLVFMVENLIKKTNSKASGFYLYNHKNLYDSINNLADSEKKILLIGVSYALLDFVEQYKFKKAIKNLIVMETGGMKGKRKEISKSSLHTILKESFKLCNIHSEYGMTELLSQAYSYGKGIFKTPPWMKILISDLTDPFSLVKNGKTGIVKIVDLANIYSCSFIQTQDVGFKQADDTFKILGRLSMADTRGCNLMID